MDSGFSAASSVTCQLSVAHCYGATVNHTSSINLNSMSGKQKAFCGAYLQNLG